jgi:hypothetical protein
MEKSGGGVMGGAGSTNNSSSIEIEGNVQAARRNSHYHAKAFVSVGFTLGLGPTVADLQLGHERFYGIKAEIRRSGRRQMPSSC